MKIVTKDDLIDVYLKIKQRGLGFILSKLNPKGISRTKSAFSNSATQSSNWWIIPKVRERWNEKITSNKKEIYEYYVLKKYLKNKKGIRMLSIGSGVCSHELIFATYQNFEEIVCIDIAENLLQKAKVKAANLGLTNLTFKAVDIRKVKIEPAYYDIILFHSSLHHFAKIEELISEKVVPWLKPNGLLIINEYVGKNRLQFPNNQIKAINDGLKIIPKHLKQRYQSSMFKNQYFGSGIIRMIIADPSECIESENILPAIKKHFEVIEEKPYGGNLLMNILKDISHNFAEADNEEAAIVLDKLFKLEDDYLLNNKSDFIFGVYKKMPFRNSRYTPTY